MDSNQSVDSAFTTAVKIFSFIFQSFRIVISVVLIWLWITVIYMMSQPIKGNGGQAHMIELMIIIFVLLPATLILLLSFIIEYMCKKKSKTPKEKIYTHDFTFPHFHQEPLVYQEPHFHQGPQNFYQEHTQEPKKDEDIDWRNLQEHTEKENCELKNKIKRLEHLLNISNNAYYELQKIN